MTQEELKSQGLLLPEQHWGELDLHTSVNKTGLLGTVALAIASVMLMVLGNGQFLTWIGAGLFVLFLILFTIVSNQGINRQAKRLQSLLEEQASASSEDPVDV